MSRTSQVFKVHRNEPELITPAKPTPHEFKLLSDFDNIKIQLPIIHVYPYNPSMEGVDPVKVIRKAISETLVYYYPFAGRLRQFDHSHNKLIVECTGEGVLFIEADVDVTLEESGNSLQPPFPFLEDLLYNVPGSDGMLNCPLILIQVTRLKCGGFVLGARFNHTMCDGSGIAQFISAMAEIARGKKVPSVLPVWERHVLTARNPPNTTSSQADYEDLPSTHNPTVQFHHHDEDLVYQSFVLGSKDISTIRKSIPPHLDYCSSFEILTACLWKCRTIALQPDPAQIMRMACVFNARYRGFNPPIVPEGYYGNAVVTSSATSTAEQLTRNPVEYALKLIRKAKQSVTKEFIYSKLDTIGNIRYHMDPGSHAISDMRHLGLSETNFGWGNAIYGGPPRAFTPGASYYLPHQIKKGEIGTLMHVCLQAQAMDRFVKEAQKIFPFMRLHTL